MTNTDQKIVNILNTIMKKCDCTIIELDNNNIRWNDTYTNVYIEYDNIKEFLFNEKIGLFAYLKHKRHNICILKNKKHNQINTRILNDYLISYDSILSMESETIEELILKLQLNGYWK